MTPARRYRIWRAADGYCEHCGIFFELDEVEIDHRIAWWISHDDSDTNLRVLCIPCHRGQKTPEDQGIIAKLKRLIARKDGTRRERKEIPSKGFPPRVKTNWPKRPFRR
jgi:5-methylcytosine-specific restriction endonuclease McrA